jgi:competence protein ComEC
MGPPQFAFGIVLAFGAGIFFSSFLFSSFFIIFAFLVIGITLTSVFWTRVKGMYAGALFLAAAFGMAHYANTAQLPDVMAQPQEVSFEGRVVEAKEKDEQGRKVVVETKQGSGRILLFTSLFEEIREGDRVLVSGKLQSPEVFEDFNYPLFLAKDKIFFVMFSPKIVVREQGRPLLFGLRERLQEKIDTFLPLPESSLLAAMLLGNKAALPADFKEKLNSTGTRHITAVSGMHVAILSGMLFSLLLNLGLEKKKSSLVVFGFLVFFVVFTGFQSSAVRAGIMASCFLLSGLLGRKNSSVRILMFAGGSMLFFNPLLLAHDIGFQLSFLAVFGILALVPLFQYFLRFLPNPFALRDILFMSVAAQVFTFPLLAHEFGVFSLVSIGANLVLVPFLPLVLFLGGVFLATTFLLPFAASTVALFEGLLLSYLVFAIDWFAKLPFASLMVPEFSLWVVAALLVPLSLFALRVGKTKQFQFSEGIMI